MTSPPKARASAFGRAREGATAVEFALIAPVFFMFFFIFLEMGLLMLRVASADDATSQVARLVYTGAATNGTVSSTDIETFICERVSFFEECEKNIMIEATVIETFADQPDTAAPCKDSTQPEFSPAATYNTGQQSEIVFLRVCLTTDPFFPWYGLGNYLAHTETGRIQIISSLAFANEPF